MITEKDIQQIVTKIAKKYKPEKIILFGSFAWGKPTEDSDIDLLIIKNTNKKFYERIPEVKKIIKGSLPTDIIVYTPEEVDERINISRNLFIEDILRNGKVLYTKPKVFLNITLPKRELIILH